MRAYLQLLRLPNVFTAAADIMLGYLFTHEGPEPLVPFVFLLATSASLYLAGMVLNDLFDRDQDARERPHRPIPSGRVSTTAARRLGIALLAVGLACGAGAAAVGHDLRPVVVAALLAIAVVGYDARWKRTLLGPLAMGACRVLNVLLGMSLADGPWRSTHLVVAGGVGLYIVGVTVFARSEARTSGRPQLALGAVLIALGIALVSSLPHWISGDEWPPVRVPDRWYLFWGLLGMLLMWRALRAILDPRPAQVQAAVRNCIFALVIIDAGTCLAVQDRMWGLAILALLVPAVLLGRWIEST
jgi:4-hydroxybenzoate polyprenyltransferase